MKEKQHSGNSVEYPQLNINATAALILALHLKEATLAYCSLHCPVRAGFEPSLMHL